jgi:hypothetical protein
MMNDDQIRVVVVFFSYKNPDFVDFIESKWEYKIFGN